MPKTKQTGNARYTIHIPTHDTLGNPLTDLSLNAQSYLTKNLGRLIHTLHVEGPYQHNNGTHRHLHVLAHDTPQVDTHVKSMATELGGMANHPVITVIKESQQGIHPWTMQNKRFDPHALASAGFPELPAPTIDWGSRHDVLRSSKARRWLRGDKSLPTL